MTTFNIEANMKTQNQFSARTNPTSRSADFQSAFTELPIPKPATSRRCVAPGPAPLINTPLQRGVTTRQRGLNRFSGFPGRTGFCEASETAEAVPRSSRHGSTPLKRGVNEIRTAATALLSLLLWAAWLALPGTVSAQPADYTNDTDVATYVEGMLYWPDAAPTNQNIAAFRYKQLLYANTGVVAPQLTNMANLYGNNERTRAALAESYLQAGLTNNPASNLLAGLLLDLYYDRTAAEFILAANSLSSADLARMGPPTVATGFVIDDEINVYQSALAAYRSALMAYFSLLSDNLGLTNVPPAGYQWFQQLAPSRSLAPASYLSNGVPTSVTGNTNALFTGYKDLVLLFNGLRDYSRATVPLARLQWARNNPGDLAAAQRLIADSQRFLFLESSTLLAIFPGLDPTDTNVVDAASGLAQAVAGVTESQGELETMRQTILSGASLLGFANDFLMLMQQFPGQSGTIYDSFDSFQLQLAPGNLSSPLAYALDLLTDEISSYDEYMGAQDQLNEQLENVTDSANDRLFQIVGAYPGTPAYATPQNNVGSEIWQQVQSIQVAQLRIKNNQVQMDDLNQEVQIEIASAAQVENVTIHYANEDAKLTTEIGAINAVQAAASAAADAVSDWDQPWSAGADAVNGAIQAGCEVAKGLLEAQKERDAGLEQATITGINTAADVKTKLLGMNTLVVDSQEDAVLLGQEMGRLVALLSEKANLEATLAESQQDIQGRYFADPIHHLRYQDATMLANLSFDEAQKWLYFMARALEYKWNTPFQNYSYLGRLWDTGMLYKLRNADELEQFYNAMVSFNSLVQLPENAYWDGYSLREDFFGYKQYDATGTNLLYYPDPANPSGPTNLTAIQAFQQKLKGLTNSVGDITLNFSTVQQLPGGTFFLGPRFDANENVLSPGLCLDKIQWIWINLPGNHTLGLSTLAGQLTYGGTSFIRNINVGTFVPGRPNLITNEMTAYSTRYWYFDPTIASWRFSEALQSAVTMTLTNVPINSVTSSSVPITDQIDVFGERSVATTGWVLSIPTQDLGVPVLDIDELDDVQLYFFHYAVSRQMPED